MQEQEREVHWYGLAAAVTLALAAVLRFRDLSPSIYEDESWVADLILRRPWEPHYWLTPPLFYAFAKVWTLVRGTTLEILREPPALFGVLVAAVPLLATTFDRLTRYLWMFLLAFSSPLLFYSTRLKQYTLEATVAAVLIVCFLRAVETSRRAWILFFLVAFLGVATLYSPIFVVFAAGAAALFVARDSLRHTLPLFILVAIVFGAAYLGYLAPGPESTRVHGDMNEFFSARQRWMTSPGAVVTATLHWTGQAFNLTRFWWLVVIAGVVAWLTRRGNTKLKIAVLCLALVPPAVIAAVSALRYYPYGEVRLMTFAIPALMLLAAHGLASLAGTLRHAGTAVVIGFCALFLWGGVVRQTYNTTHMRVFDLRPLYDFVALHHHPGEPIFVDTSNVGPLPFHHPELARDLRQAAPDAPGWFVGRPSSLRVPASVWFRIGDTVAARVSGSGAAGARQMPPPAQEEHHQDGNRP